MSELETAVRRFFQRVWSEGDIEAAADFLAPEFTSHNSFDVTILGPIDYGQAVLQYRQAFPDLVTTVEDVFAVDDRVAVRGIDRATHRGEFMGRAASGRTVTTSWIEIFRIQDGKAVEGWVETNLQHLLDQLS
jgi:predicted ester cyclase